MGNHQIHPFHGNFCVTDLHKTGKHYATSFGQADIITYLLYGLRPLSHSL